MDGVHRRLASVSREATRAVRGTIQGSTEVAVQVSEKFANFGAGVSGYSAGSGDTHNCFDLVSLAGKLIVRGTAPPPSRKLTDTAVSLTLVDLSAPLKYCARLTDDPLKVAFGLRIPGTALWLGWV